MKVTYIANEYPPNVYGGAGVHLKYLSKEISKLMDVEVKCFGGGERMEGNIKVTGYEMWDRLTGGYDPRFKSALGAVSINLAMARDGIDSEIVHTHTWYAAYAGYLAKLLYGTKFVLTCHSLEPLRPWKKDQLGSAYNLSTWLEKVGVESADKVVAVSSFMKEDILKYFNIKEENLAVVHNGIDLDIWKRKPLSDSLKKEYGIEDDYILFVGRPTPQKGMEYLVEAADDIDAQIVMGAAGADTKEYEERMKSRVAKKKNILWIHKLLKEDECVQLYSSAKVFVCPSVYEPFGIINLEAMACKTPVVASAVGGIKDVVIPEKTGLLVQPAEPKQISSAVNRLLKDKGLSERMGENGRARVEEKFSWTKIAQQTKELYESLI